MIGAVCPNLANSAARKDPRTIVSGHDEWRPPGYLQCGNWTGAIRFELGSKGSRRDIVVAVDDESELSGESPLTPGPSPAAGRGETRAEASPHTETEVDETASSEEQETLSGFEAAAAKVRTFPQSPGVYLMKDAAGVVIYVGKAKNSAAPGPAAIFSRPRRKIVAQRS